MQFLKAGLAVGAIIFGAAAVLLGFVLALAALRTGAVTISYLDAERMIKETVTRASDAARYWRLVVGLGIAPMLIGGAALAWGWRRIRR